MLNIAHSSTIFPRSRALVLSDIMNDVDLCVWVADAKPSARIVYYTGHLSRDRLPHNDGYSEAVRCKIGELGNAAWMLGDENWVHLVQRRVIAGCWEYIAVRRADTPKQKPVYRIIQSLAANVKGERRGGQPITGNVKATGPPA
jgi:hypothetical protein